MFGNKFLTATDFIFLEVCSVAFVVGATFFDVGCIIFVFGITSDVVGYAVSYIFFEVGSISYDFEARTTFTYETVINTFTFRILWTVNITFCVKNT